MSKITNETWLNPVWHRKPGPYGNSGHQKVNNVGWSCSIAQGDLAVEESDIVIIDIVHVLSAVSRTCLWSRLFSQYWSRAELVCHTERILNALYDWLIELSRQLLITWSVIKLDIFLWHTTDPLVEDDFGVISERSLVLKKLWQTLRLTDWQTCCDSEIYRYAMCTILHCTVQ